MEEWRQVAGWPYEVSNRGNVRRQGPSAGNHISYPGRPVKPSANPNGYLCVNMTGNGRRLRAAIHVLVLEAFAGPRQAGDVGNHLDGVKTNNALTNLEWTTHAGNMAHASATGLSPRGERQHQAKLTDVQVRAIAEALKADTTRGSLRRIAKRFGVTSANIGYIKRGATWSHITGIHAGSI